MGAQLPGRDSRADLRPGRIALLYTAIGLAWIFGSGFLVAAVTRGATSEVIEIGKGAGFVLVTASALYVVLVRRARSIWHAEAARSAALDERMRLAAAIEQVAEAVIVTDREAKIVYVNPAFEQVSGYSKAELVGRNPRLLQSGRLGRDFYAGLWSTLVAGKTWSGTFINRRKDGVVYEEDAIITPIRDAGGTVVSYVGVKRDVSRERAVERELAAAGRMEAVGVLAGGIAHDFNNMLTAIAGYAGLLREEVAPESPARREVEEILRASQSAAGLVRQLLAFGRRQVLEPRALALDSLLEHLAPMLDGLLGPRVRLEVHSARRLDPIFADPGQLEQVLVNLAVNARDAMPTGGTFTVALRAADVDAGSDRADIVPPGRYVVLTAADTGAGMDEATLARVFEPFFTTKPLGQGTGLGLATTYGIVKQSGGYLFADSAPGQGATFTLYLPSHPGPVAAVEPTPRVAPAAGGHETVLVVEDDPAVRELIRLALERLGYEVAAVSDAEEARAAVAAGLGRVPLLVTDIRLPGLDGLALAANLRADLPDLRVLFVSGYGGDAMVERGLLGADEAFLAKPFSADELGHRVRSLLDADSFG